LWLRRGNPSRLEHRSVNESTGVGQRRHLAVLDRTLCDQVSGNLVEPAIHLKQQVSPCILQAVADLFCRTATLDNNPVGIQGGIKDNYLVAVVSKRPKSMPIEDIKSLSQ
jgi:hypothetical protein